MDLIVKGSNSVASAIGGLFQNVDFTGMSTIISNIGDVSKDLTDGEKQLATGLIKEWEKDIVSTLNDKNEEMKSFIDFLNLNDRSAYYYYESEAEEMHDTYGAVLAEKTGTNELYQKYLDKMQEARDFKTENKPEEKTIGSDSSIKDSIISEAEYNKLSSIYQIDLTRLERDAYKIEREWKKEVLKNQEVKDLLLAAKKFNKNVTKLKNECQAKSRLAKLNVAISSKEAREALAELINFKIAL